MSAFSPKRLQGVRSSWPTGRHAAGAGGQPSRRLGLASAPRAARPAAASRASQLSENANEELYGGWPMIVSGLKTLLETGELLETPGSQRYSQMGA